jgi:hypothetical protein
MRPGNPSTGSHSSALNLGPKRRTVIPTALTQPEVADEKQDRDEEKVIVEQARLKYEPGAEEQYGKDLGPVSRLVEGKLGSCIP